MNPLYGNSVRPVKFRVNNANIIIPIGNNYENIKENKLTCFKVRNITFNLRENDGHNVFRIKMVRIVATSITIADY